MEQRSDQSGIGESRVKSRSIKDLMVEIVQSPISGNTLVEAAGELIAEHARFNAWCHARKVRSTTTELWAMAGFSRRVNEICSAAWRSYATTDDKSLALGEMLAALRLAREQLHTVRVSDRIDPESDMPDELRE